MRSLDNPDFDSVITDEILGIADVIISSGDGADSKIENASQGDVIAFETGVTFDVSNPTIPAEVTVYGNGATLRKSSNGAIASLDNRGGQTIYNLTFDGNKSNYTGDGVVDTYFNPTSYEFINVTITNVAGDARVLDSGGRFLYLNCVFNADGWGIKLTESQNDDGARRGEFVNCNVGATGGGVYAPSGNQPPDDIKFDIDFSSATGTNNPAYKFEVGGGRIEIDGSIRNQDGPAILCDGGVPVLKLSCTLSSNVDNPSGLTSPVGSVHIESGGGDQVFHTTPKFRPGGNNDADDSLFSNQSANQHNLTLNGGKLTADMSVDGDWRVQHNAKSSFERLSFASDVGSVDWGSLESGQARADNGRVYNSLGDALGAASDYVELGAGTFSEDVDVSTDGLTIMGQGPRATTVDGGANPAFDISADNVTIQDLSARSNSGSNSSAIRESGTPRTSEVDNVVILESGGKGIWLPFSTQGRVQDCIVENCDGNGIEASDTGAVIENCRLESGVGNHGIITTGGESKIEGNQIDGTGADGIECKGDDATVRGNTSKNNSSVGILVSGDKQVLVGNRSFGNSGADINDNNATNIAKAANATGT